MCFWMNSRRINEGTEFSYAVSGEPNELLVHDYRNFALFIGGERAELVIMFIP